MNVTITRLSFTTTPDSATRPNIDMKLTFSPMKMWPQIAPTRPNGMALMMISGWMYDLSGTASSAKIASSATMYPDWSPPTASSCSACTPSNT